MALLPGWLAIYIVTIQADQAQKDSTLHDGTDIWFDSLPLISDRVPVGLRAISRQRGPSVNSFTG